MAEIFPLWPFWQQMKTEFAEDSPLLDPPPGKNPLNIFFREKSSQMPLKLVGDIIRRCHPPVCPPSAVHRSDPPRLQGDQGDPATHRSARDV